MQTLRKRSGATGAAIGIAAFLAICTYFAFAAVQGEFGHLKRVEIESEGQALQTELAQLMQERIKLQNKSKRLSDGYLDLELLDERARKVLGLARQSEIIIR